MEMEKYGEKEESDSQWMTANHNRETVIQYLWSSEQSFGDEIINNVVDGRLDADARL